MLIHQNYLKFITIYEERSLSKAAIKLDVYQGALSKLLKSIELDLQNTLFIRTNRGLIPTDYSTQLYNQVKKQSISWNNFINTKEDNTLSGIVRFGGHPIILNQFKENFSNLIQSYKKLDLHFNFNRSSEVTRQVLNFDIEFGLVINPKKFDDLILKKIESDEIAMFSKSKNYNKDIIIYNPEITTEAIIHKKFKQKVRLLANANLSLSMGLAKSLNCPIIIPEKIAFNNGFKHQVGNSFASNNVFLIYRSEQRQSINTQLVSKFF